MTTAQSKWAVPLALSALCWAIVAFCQLASHRASPLPAASVSQQTPPPPPAVEGPKVMPKFLAHRMAVPGSLAQRWQPPKALAAAIPNQSLPRQLIEHPVVNGETLESILFQYGVADTDLAALLSVKGGTAFSQGLLPGDVLYLLIDNNRLARLQYDVDHGQVAAAVWRDHQRVRVTTADAALKTVEQVYEGTIRHSLLVDAEHAGVPNRVAKRLTEVFRDSIDFKRDIKKGDRFRLVVAAQQDIRGETIGADLLAAEITSRGKSWKALVNQEKNGRIAFYKPNGQGLNLETLLAPPIPSARVSSGFTHSRFHPVLGRYVPHRGVDYAAPYGTPVRAAADGTVTYAGYKGAYGKAIEIRHAHPYATLYGHMSRLARGITPGTRVKQGQLIGYVGSTGRSTGPHLHYEVRVKGQPSDPLKIAAAPRRLDGAALAKFKARSRPWMAALSSGTAGERTSRIDIEHADTF